MPSTVSLAVGGVVRRSLSAAMKSVEKESVVRRSKSDVTKREMTARSLSLASPPSQPPQTNITGGAKNRIAAQRGFTFIHSARHM